jgi:hypothetical protein
MTAFAPQSPEKPSQTAIASLLNTGPVLAKALSPKQVRGITVAVSGDHSSR